MKKLRFGLIVAALVFAACDKIEVVALEPQSEQQALMTRTSISDDGHTYEVVTVGKTDLVLMDGTTYLLSDDIILSPGQVEFLRQEGLPQETVSATRAAVSTKFVEYWPNGTIYYTIANNFLQPERVNNTIEHYHDNTGIRFVPRTNQRNYIEFVNVSGTTSWSYIGMIGEKQQIQISAGGTMGTVLHEVGHALGMYHEHERTDRNMYVQIHTNNITSGNAQWFDIETKALPIGPFDFGSVMMYHSWSFAKEGTCSITGTDGSYIYDNNYLSSGDVYALKIMYEPDRSSVYVKLRKELIEEESWSMFGPTWEDWYYVERNWLEFYSDSRCTNRISSPEAITQVEIQYTIG